MIKYLNALIIFISLQVTNTYAKTQKVALVTGGLTGLGNSITLALQHEGYKVWASSHIPAMRQCPEGIQAVTINFKRNTSIREAVNTIIAEDGRIDVLVNNAGRNVFGPVEITSTRETRKLFDVNFFGALATMQAVIPHMRRQNSGTIINITSHVSKDNPAGMGIFSASKAALETLTQALQTELKPWHIKISNVQTGLLQTDWAKNSKVIVSHFKPYVKYTKALKEKLTEEAKTATTPKTVAKHVINTVREANVDLIQVA